MITPRPPNPDSPNNDGSTAGLTAALRLDHIVVEKGGQKILDDISLECRPGTVTCVIGPSGAGKTTLLRSANLLAPIVAGTVSLDGTPIFRARRIPSPSASRSFMRRLLWKENGAADTRREYIAPPAEVRRKVGMVFQEYGLFDQFSVIRNLTEAPVYVLGQQRLAAEDRARALLARFGMADLAGRMPRTLSGGQRQRVAIARALMLEPRVLLLDEVTSALDPEVAAEVLDFVRELCDHNRTVVMVTHHLDLVAEVADSVVVLDHGRVVETGTPQKVLENPSAQRTADFVRRVRRAR